MVCDVWTSQGKNLKGVTRRYRRNVKPAIAENVKVRRIGGEAVNQNEDAGEKIVVRINII
jgi:hypothetical protein